MITLEAIRTLFAYDTWATGKVLEACSGMPDAEFTAGEGRTSLRGTLEHIIEAKTTWLSRWRSGDSDRKEVVAAGDLDDVRDRARRLERRLEAYLLELDDAALDREIVFTSATGQRYVEQLWQQMFHLVNHGTQHRSEAAVVLTRAQRSPGSLDFLVSLEQMPSPTPPAR